MIRDEDVRNTVKELGEHIGKTYLEAHQEKDRDWRTYEQQFSKRIKEAMKALDPLIHEAVSAIRIEEGRRGRPDSLTLEQKVKLLLIKQLVGESNRMFANMLEIFSMLSGIDISYKTVERLYSDDLVMMALHNLHILMLRKKGVESSDASGDGTGYSLTISKHYESVSQELKDKAKEQPEEKKTSLSSVKEEANRTKHAFAYVFRLMDLPSKMYLSYGSSMKSEKEAFDNAMRMLTNIDVTLKTVRLDRYYSTPGYVDSFGDTKVFVIPKSNATLNGSWKWKTTMIMFVKDTI
ncbi:MAG TPA: ISNCY family transposase, partial [Candidatus Hodarchaeales archaeon]|nr:ISNCY family transposase [Candidatus Hodarchaeales archaeon]